MSFEFAPIVRVIFSDDTSFGKENNKIYISPHLTPSHPSSGHGFWDGFIFYLHYKEPLILNAVQTLQRVQFSEGKLSQPF